MDSTLMKKLTCLIFWIGWSAVFSQDTLSICSFNIQFLGHFQNRENTVLANILKAHDIVVVQEMVAAPVNGNYPDGTAYKQDNESAAFLQEMEKKGFSYWMSQEDTGPTKNHTPTTASEWWIVFYKKDKVLPDTNRCKGFVSAPLVANPVYERVPYAFSFKAVNGPLNFTLVSVHLKPGDGKEEKETRQNELKELFRWTSAQMESNKDFFVLGDCNIYDRSEFSAFKEKDVYSLNDDCLSTNTKMYESKDKGKPYDHVFYTSYSRQDLVNGSFEVVDLMKEIKNYSKPGQFSLTPYIHDEFRTMFSDHVPVTFKLLTGKDTDL
jgi:endonuclease/exonuclease/phosphatase family metal-dependent hydrolase